MQKSITKYLTLATVATLANLSSGLLAILAASQHDYWLACILLFVGAWFDIMDGYIAKHHGQATDFGAEMDSLADLVTFGVAPMFIIMSYYNTNWLSVLTLLIPLCGALRLARHNVNRVKTKDYFIGVPIDTSCIVVPLLLFCVDNLLIVAFTIAILCWLYVSTLKVPRLFI